MRVDASGLFGIPLLWDTVSNSSPPSRKGLSGLPEPVGEGQGTRWPIQCSVCAARDIEAITDLLLLHLTRLAAARPSMKLVR